MELDIEIIILLLLIEKLWMISYLYVIELFLKNEIFPNNFLLILFTSLLHAILAPYRNSVFATFLLDDFLF